MNNLKKLVFVASTVIGMGTAPTQAADINVPSGVYQLDRTHASLVWSVSHFGLSNYTARFTDFDVSLTLDTENLEESLVNVSIDPTSVRTDYVGDVDFDREISSDPKFLNSEEYPSIEFMSSSIELLKEDKALIHGTLTMLGISKPFTLKAKLNGALASHPYAKKAAVGFGATGTVKRSDFGFTHLLPYVGDEVHFSVEAEFIKSE